MRRFVRTLVAAALTFGLTVNGTGIARGGHDPATVDTTHLVAELAEANQRLRDLGASIQARQEGVNKAIVEVESARDAAAAARRDADTAQQAIRDASAAVAESTARAARQRADQAAADAQQQFGGQRAEIDRLVAQRNAARAGLDAAGAGSTPTGAPPTRWPS